MQFVNASVVSVYGTHMTPALVGSSVPQCMKLSYVLDIFNFHPGLLLVLSGPWLLLLNSPTLLSHLKSY